MKVLVFGGAGMLGHKLVQSWNKEFEVFTTIRGAFADIERFGIFAKDRTFEHVEAENTDLIRKIAHEVMPDVVINAIGIVKQVPTSADVIKSIWMNALLPHQLAEISAACGARFISIGTDCVFDGKKGNYTEEDAPTASDLYGKSKNLGEVAYGRSLTLRTSIIGRELFTQHGLAEWFLSNSGGKVKGFTNAIYSGFPTIVLAEIIADLIRNHGDLNGLYHLSSVPISKFDLLELLNTCFTAEIELEPFADFKLDRSLDSAKFRQATGFRPDSWEEMIKKMAADDTPYEDWRK